MKSLQAAPKYTLWLPLPENLERIRYGSQNLAVLGIFN
jgi:hypothetical protein